MKSFMHILIVILIIVGSMIGLGIMSGDKAIINLMNGKAMFPVSKEVKTVVKAEVVKEKSDSESVEELNKLNDIENAKLQKANEQRAMVEKKYSKDTYKKSTVPGQESIEELNKMGEADNLKLQKANEQRKIVEKNYQEQVKNDKSTVPASSKTTAVNSKKLATAKLENSKMDKKRKENDAATNKQKEEVLKRNRLSKEREAKIQDNKTEAELEIEYAIENEKLKRKNLLRAKIDMEEDN